MATTHDHSALIRNIQLATGVTTVAATGLLAASAHMLFRFAMTRSGSIPFSIRR